MTELLDRTDWDILLEYDKDPFQSYNSISKAVGVHHSTVSDRITQMKAQNILREDNFYNDEARGNLLRLESEVIGEYSPVQVGLIRVHALFNRIDTIEDYNKLHNYCDYHPYTHYFTKLFGFGVSLYAQFDIPPNSFGAHKKAFEELKEYINFESVELFQDKYEVRAIPNFSSLKQYSQRHSLNVIDDLWESFLDERSHKKLEVPTQKKEFDNIDAELIRELTINGKMKISDKVHDIDMTEYFNLTKSTLSRRVSKIRDNFVSRARLVFGIAADRLFGFNNAQIVTGSFKKDSELNSELFLKFINSDNILPFDSFLSVHQDRFLLLIRTSNGIAGDLMHFLYENTKPHFLNQYQFYIANALRYPYYHGNYHEEDGYNISEDHIRTEPLNYIINN